MVLVSIGATIAGVVEMWRKNIMQDPGGWMEQTLAGEKFNASKLSVFVQIPQFAIVGGSEVFTSIAGKHIYPCLKNSKLLHILPTFRISMKNISK